MVGLVAIYEASLEEVCQHWLREAKSLGFTDHEPTDFFDPAWECQLGAGYSVFVSARRIASCEKTIWLDFWFRRRDSLPPREVLERLLNCELLPIEAILLDYDPVSAPPFVAYDRQKLSPEEFLEHFDSGYHAEALHQVRAVRLDLLEPLDAWRSATESRGFGWATKGHFGLLNIHWEEAGDMEQPVDSLTGLMTERPFWQSLQGHDASPTGTIIVVKLTDVDGGPDASHSDWCSGIVQVANLLRETVPENGVIARFYTPRRFGIIHPSVSKIRAQVLVSDITSLLESRLPSLEGVVVIASWPEDASNPLDLFEILLARESCSGSDSAGFGRK